MVFYENFGGFDKTIHNLISIVHIFWQFQIKHLFPFSTYSRKVIFLTHLFKFNFSPVSWEKGDSLNKINLTRFVEYFIRFKFQFNMIPILLQIKFFRGKRSSKQFEYRERNTTRIYLFENLAYCFFRIVFSHFNHRKWVIIKTQNDSSVEFIPKLNFFLVIFPKFEKRWEPCIIFIYKANGVH